MENQMSKKIENSEYYIKYRMTDSYRESHAIFDNLTQHEVEDRHIASRDIKERFQENGQWQERTKTLYYYQWASAWQELMRRFPDAKIEWKEFERDGKLYGCMYYPDGTAEVWCKITINGLTREMWLPVMDYNQKAISNPNSKDISDARMRCMVKCIALFGLGLDIFMGKYDPIKLGDPRAKTITLGEAKEKGLLP